MEIRCTSCGAQVPIQERTQFQQCQHCGAALIVDLGEGVPHYLLSPVLEHGGLEPALRRALAQREISAPIGTVAAEMIYLPFWRFEREAGQAFMIAASAPGAEDLGRLVPPPGEERFFREEHAGAHRVAEPTVLLETARAEASGAAAAETKDDLRESLVHVPFFRIEYGCDGGTYVAWMEAVSGNAFSDGWPPSPQRRKDLVLGAVALISIAVFFSETVFLSTLWLLIAFPLTAIALFLFARALLGRLSW
jgi:hypothetical protein